MSEFKAVGSLETGDVVVMTDGQVHTVVKVEGSEITLVRGAYGPEHITRAAENNPTGSMNPERDGGQDFSLLVLNTN